MRIRDIASYVTGNAIVPEPRTGSDSPRLDESEFKRRFRSQFQDPAFDVLGPELERIAEVAWDGYAHGRKSPRTRKAGPGYADPDYDLAVDWIAARDAIKAAQARHEDPNGPLRVLLINGSSRSEHTCPSEVSKSWRLAQLAREVLDAAISVRFLDLSQLASEYGAISTPARPASRRRPRSATGRARAIRTIRVARLRT